MNRLPSLALPTSAVINSIFAPLGSCVVPCQAVAVYRGEQGQRARLIDLARRLTQHTRRLACLFGDGVPGYANNDNDSHT